MRASTAICISVLAVATIFLPTMQADSRDNAPPKGFAALFNGTDLTGWKGLVGDPVARARMTPADLAKAQQEADESMRAHWTVTDGVIRCDGKNWKNGDHLCTVKDYSDFELYVDWKIPLAGDSGIYLRGSPQVQIWDTAHMPFWINGADKGSGGLWNNEKNERFPLEKADLPAGQWNTFNIKMVGDRVTVKLNDKTVVDNVVMENYWERTKPIYATGAIELQNHGYEVWFKNIYVRELSGSKASAR